MSGMIGLDPASRALVSGGPYAEAKQASSANIARLRDEHTAALFVHSAELAALVHEHARVYLTTILQILSLLCAALPDWGLTLEHLVAIPCIARRASRRAVCLFLNDEI